MKSGDLFLGRYLLADELPALAINHTFLATDQSLGRYVEVTVLDARFAQHPTFTSKFIEEARKSLDLAHPAIARIYDVGQDDASGACFIISEHVEGVPLKEYVVSENPSVDSALTLMESVFSALEYAHLRKALHLGLSPQSIVVTPRGRSKIRGFGITSLAASTAPNADALAATLGTSGYLAPEQILGLPLGPATDNYAAGLMLQELVNHGPVFDGALRGEGLLNRAHEPMNPQSLHPALPTEVSSLVLSLGDLTAARRPSAGSAAEVLARSVTPHSSILPTEAVLADTQLFTPVAAPASEGEFSPPSALPEGIDGELAKVFPLNTLSTRAFSANEFTAGRTRRALITAVVAALAGVVVLAAAVLAIVSILPANFLPSTSRTVPQVTGLTYEQALASVHDAGLIMTRHDVPSTTIIEGLVISSTPAAGTKLEVGATVEVEVSAGATMIAVPDLTGVGVTAARTLVEQAGLKVGKVIQAPSALAPTGAVAFSQPASGTKVAAGTVIDLSVANGLVKLPQLVGKSISEATSIVSAPAIGITPKIESDSTCPATTPVSVNKQLPSPGDIPRNSQVVLTYCSGR